MPFQGRLARLQHDARRVDLRRVEPESVPAAGEARSILAAGISNASTPAAREVPSRSARVIGARVRSPRHLAETARAVRRATAIPGERISIVRVAASLRVMRHAVPAAWPDSAAAAPAFRSSQLLRHRRASPVPRQQLQPRGAPLAGQVRIPPPPRPRPARLGRRAVARLVAEPRSRAG